MHGHCQQVPGVISNWSSEVGGENSVLEVPVLEAVELEASEEEPR